MNLHRVLGVLGFVATVLLLFPSCGGGGGGIFWEGPFTAPLTSVPGRDGWVSSTGLFDDGSAACVGDRDAITNWRSDRALFCFDISSIPGNARIEEATLFVYQESTLGNPYDGWRGPLVVDHVTLGSGVSAGDYAGGTLVSEVGTLSTNAVQEWKSVLVRFQVEDDIANGRTTSEFRLRFRDGNADGDGISDYVRVNDGEDSRGSGNLPRLEVRFSTPGL